MSPFLKTGVFPLIFLSCLFGSCVQNNNTEYRKNDEYDGPEKAMEMEFNRTKDPATGTVPRDRLLSAMQHTDSLKAILPFQLIAGYGNWTERGPSADAVGTSNGNTRANSGKASGRVRTMLVDANDATGNTVFVGAVDGGLWKTTDITVSSPTWTLINDFFVNMAITSICQDPTNAQIMYFATGEGFFNADGVRGQGVWKTTNGGSTWTQLPSTTGFLRGTKIVCDAAGNIYLGDRNTGLLRSVNGGTSWTNITPAGAAGILTVADIEVSSTGRLHVTIGLAFNTTSYYFYTDNPSTTNTTTSASNWILPTTPFPTTTTDRIELACSGNTLFALPSSSATDNVATIYKSTDGGATWAATGGQPTAGWASGQGWYALGAAIDPSNANNVIVGGLEPYKTTNGGTSWSRIARWVGTTGQYVHADIHYINIYGSNRVLFGCDGGVHYSSDGGTTIRDRNAGLRIKQFYSCAIHPSTTNYFLAGAQDNGSHSFSTAGLGTTTEVSGGDGGFVHIDQDQPLFQFTSYVFNDYFRSTNGGATWTSVTLNSSTGQFINPTDYDDAANIMYCGNSPGTYLRWTDPQTGATNASVSITALNGNSVTAITVSPYTGNRVYFGTENDVGTTRLCYVDNANTIASGSAGTNISTGLPTNVYTSCIATGTNDNNLMVCYSNYGVQQVWVSTNGGTGWTNIDGDLPDMPVRWCMFVPGSNNTKALLATEAGVYLTQLINGASTAWIPSPTFPTVRTDMLQYRASDGLIAAATHGRGLWTQPYYSIMPANNFLLRGQWNTNKVALQWEYTPLSAGATLDVESSADATHFYKVGSLNSSDSKQYSYTHIPNGNTVFYRIRSNETNGVIKYSNTIKLSKTAAGEDLEIISLYPNPAGPELNFGFRTAKGKLVYTITGADGHQIRSQEEDLQFTGNFVRNLHVSGIAAGNYILTISNGSRKVSRQFIKK